jgi:hypothetical protein
MEVSAETIRKNFQLRADTELLGLAASSKEMTSEARFLLLQELDSRLAKTKEARETVQLIHGWYTVIAPIAGIKFPDSCPRCFRSGAGTPLRFTSLESHQFRFFHWKSDGVISAIPHCSDCAAELRRTRAIWSWTGGILGFLWLATAIWFRIARSVIVFGFFVISVPIAYLYDRTSTVKLGDYGKEVLEYRFKSHEYAKVFALMNHVHAENAETLQNQLEDAISSIRQ